MASCCTAATVIHQQLWPHFCPVPEVEPCLTFLRPQSPSPVNHAPRWSDTMQHSKIHNLTSCYVNYVRPASSCTTPAQSYWHRLVWAQPNPLSRPGVYVTQQIHSHFSLWSCLYVSVPSCLHFSGNVVALFYVSTPFFWQCPLKTAGWCPITTCIFYLSTYLQRIQPTCRSSVDFLTATDFTIWLSENTWPLSLCEHNGDKGSRQGVSPWCNNTIWVREMNLLHNHFSRTILAQWL